MSVYVGMDVHRKRSQVAILDQAGAVQRNRNVPNDPAELQPILGGLPASTPVAFEAAYGWGWLVELLEGLQLQPHLVHPSRCKAIASARLKNDKVDAETLAQLLRGDLLPEAWIAPQPVGDLRALLRHRVSLVRLSTASKNRVHAVLADRGVHQHTSLWTAAGRAWLAALELPPVPRPIVDDCCGLIDALAEPIGRLEREIGKLAKPDPRMEALMALPGVGRLTAMTLLAEIGDISRFGSARKLCALSSRPRPARALPLTRPCGASHALPRARLASTDRVKSEPDHVAAQHGGLVHQASRPGPTIASTSMSSRGPHPSGRADRGRGSAEQRGEIGANPGPVGWRDRPDSNRVSAGQIWCGRTRIRTWVGASRRFYRSHRRLPAGLLPSPPGPQHRP